MSKALMIQGTGSGVGKSLIVAGLCRIFNDMGINVAPFKAQNMALNSFVTKDGGEIGRAQALQAEAARIEPSINMNPILLKASGEAGCQVIVNGRVHSNMKAQEYYAFKNEAWMAVTQAYERLSKRYDLIIVEGAGSPAEINLSTDEVVNMRVARYTNAPVILVGDIDKGGVFASLYGTIELLKDGSNRSNSLNGLNSLNCLNKNRCSDADYIKAFIINKFRGDIEILRPGLKMIENKTGRPVIGVINYHGDLGLHEEDAIPIERLKRFKQFKQFKPFKRFKQLKIVVLKLRYISNFTDFDPFLYEPDVELLYSLRESDIENADILIIPGSKNTMKDLLLLRENGIEESIKRAVKKGIPLIGICGGYQMLGGKIFDPYAVESSVREIDGLGLLDIETTLERIKTTCQVEAELINSSSLFNVVQDSLNCDLKNLKGYEIHMGVTTGDIGLFKINRLNCSSSSKGLNGLNGLNCLNNTILDGSLKGNVWGTYIHGIFDADQFRRALVNSIRIKKGLRPLEGIVNYSKLRDDALNKWAEILRETIDMKFIDGLIKG